MRAESFLALVHNAALLLALALLYDLVTTRWRTRGSPARQISVGLVVGAIGIAVMLTPWTFSPGIIFDTRSVLLAVSGLFFGTVPTVIAMAATAALRLAQGGAATRMGVSVILASGLIGIAWRRFHLRPLREISLRELYGLGITVHLVMLLLAFTLPLPTALRVLGGIALPVMFIYPLATAILGALLANRLRREASLDDLRDSERRFRTLFDQAAVGVALLETATGRFLRTNQRYADLLGLACEETAGLRFQAVTHADDVPAAEGQMKLLRSGKIHEYNLEKRYIRKDGSVCWVSVTVSPMWVPGDEPTTCVAVAKDITARKRAEEEVRRLNAGLEDSVARRTVQLEEANRELEAFSYSVSHDLRAPLRAIDGFSALVVEEHADELGAEGRRLLGVVRTNVRRMARLIDDLLAFSRTSRVEMSRRRVEMTDLARSALGEVLGDPDAQARISLLVGDLPSVEGDPPLLKQVWVNLLSNAVKFSSKKEHAVIEVEGSLDGEMAVFRVRDNGAGFDMKFAERLFGVFQRLHGADEFEGTGVGLALVQRIVARHGGWVRAEGIPGEGATITFGLPAGQSRKAPDSELPKPGG